MSTPDLRFVIAAVLSVHGLGHGGAIGALITRHLGFVEAADRSGWLAARSWLLPALPSTVCSAAATGFWLVSMIGFIAAALAFWGVLIPTEAWRALAVASAVVSTSGILLFLGTWPVFNTIAALSVNAAVFITQLWLRWPERPLVGA